MSDSLIGRRLGDFELIELIGQGGMGVAYRAQQLTLHRAAVIKVIAADRVSEEVSARFLREARLASLLDHPYAAHVYAFGREPDDLLWIAMEMVRGMPLDQLLAERGPMTLARFAPLFDRLCEVVHSAHEQGIIHRDIKPANVMIVRRAGRVLPKLLDFGIARGKMVEASDEGGPGEPDDTLIGASSRSFTMRGKLVGTPAYMAPEQWVDATRAGARSDQYALAVTAYEILTGRRPFDGVTTLEIARAHARASVPAVGPGQPAELDHVFARALAKREADRYADVLELAAAVRKIADGETAAQVDLDEVVRDRFIEGAPQPLAEALLELTATSDVTAASQAVWRVVATLLRVHVTIALAAHARIGEHALDGDAAKQTRRLVERGLDLEEWAALLAALVEPFATRPQAHAVPELVALLFSEAGPRRPFDAILARRASDGTNLRELLVELGALLRASSFVAEYPWVSANGESWMGPRRQPRQRLPVAGELESGVWLVDADGGPIIELSPLVQLAPSSPGADLEAFVLDGPAKRGRARMVAWPREFERHDLDLWEFLDRHVTRLGDQAATTDDRELAPYRGLASFGPSDASMFFGRESEVEAVVNRLRVHALLAVVGPSGVGKSSFVHAGVLPTLPESWQAVSLRPGVAPLVSLETKLTTLTSAATGLADRIASDPRALGQLLGEIAANRSGGVVLVIDQLEEVFTQCRDTATRDAFSRALAEIGGEARAIVTLRDDFLVRAAELPGLGPRLSGSLELVTLPGPEALHRILVEPLRQVGYAFENPSLPDQMIAALREHPGALALLSFAAAKLWEVRDRGFRQIPQRAYEAIGGVAGALARHAEDTLARVSADDQPLVRELFRHLVTSEGTRAALGRGEAIQLLGKGARAEGVIETLVEARLLVGYEGEGQTDRIEVIHEALLTAWPRLVTWQREDAEAARMRDQVRSSARQWGERGKPAGLLWRGEALVEYKLWRTRTSAALTDLEHEFVSGSVAAETRARRLRRFALGAVLVALTVGLIVLQRANGVAERNARESRRTALASLVEQGRATLVEDRAQEALVYLSAAYQGGADDPDLPFLLGIASRAIGAPPVVMRGHTDGVIDLTFSSDGAHVITSSLDNSMRIWNASTGALEHSIPFIPSRVTALPGNTVLAIAADNRPAVWDIATGAQRFELPTGADAHGRVARDGTLLVTLDADTIATWSATDGSPRGSLHVPQTGQFESDGDRYAMSVGDGVVVGDVDLAKPPVRLPSPPIAVRYLTIGGHGRRLIATVENSREPLLWDLDHLDAPPRTLIGHAGDVLYSQIAPDGKRVLTGSMDHTAKIWDTDRGTLLASLDGHQGYVLSMAWSSDDAEIATGSIDRTSRLWDARNGAPLNVFYGPSDLVYAVNFSLDGSRLAVGSHDGTARVYPARAASSTLELGHDGPLSLRFSGDGKRLLVVGYDNGAWVIDVATHAVIAAFDDLRVPVQAARLDAARLCGDIDRDGTHVILPVGKAARVFSVADRTSTAVVGGGPDAVSCARFAGTDRVVTATMGGELAIWVGGHRVRSFAIHKGRIDDLEVDSARGIAVTAGEDGVVSVVELDSAAPPRKRAISPLPIKGIGLVHGTGPGRIATAGYDTVARVLALDTLDQLTASHSLSDLGDVEFGTDPRRFAAANTDGRVTVYDSVDGRLLAEFGDRISGWMTSVAFVPDDSLLVTADDRGKLRFIPVANETRSPSEIATLVDCRIPLELVGTHLVPRPTTACADGDDVGKSSRRDPR